MIEPLKLYNTHSRQNEIFKSIKEGEVSLYSCGPTVYSTPHIGNMRAYSFVDLLVNVLRINHYKVNNLINITDVGHLTSDADDGEDKLDKASKLTNKNAYEIADDYTNVFYRYLQMLNIQQPSMFPKATDHIIEQINMVKELEALGYTYTTSDGVYFDTSKFEDYSSLSRLDIDGLREGERVDIGEKINKTDFALWKFSPTDQKRDMEWNSPWGKGFPGWHIECSAMARKHLGDQIDIHTGGIDHIPIHHTNEKAQTEAITGKSFVNYWMHVNFLQLLAEKDEVSDDAENKMSKSKGTAYTVDQIVDMGFDPLALKYLYLSAHYRNELKFNFSILESTAHAFKKLQNKVFQLKTEYGQDVSRETSPFVEELISLINNDLDTPKLMAKFHEILNSEISVSEKLTVVYYFDLITGLQLLDYQPETNVVPDEVNTLVSERLEAKNLKDWAKADELRDSINLLGFGIKDNKNGTEIFKL